ncbi:furin-like protease kpc-1 isoform X2 [Paramacrobiotus metropolitanus]|uniref:furin-like protease kpc-1 isoform X2 n=1 Tax=Paramacrobiotus metropolitanus TaxID=2943436 RepID=UPI002445615D|nr:furin-like protease kpc-1 isoform X2 [Paramacrobiotus metropolitanus]
MIGAGKLYNSVPRAVSICLRNYLCGYILWVILAIFTLSDSGRYRITAHEIFDQERILTYPNGSAALRSTNTNPLNPVVFLDQWAVHVTGGEKEARRLASSFGFDFINQIMDDYYLLAHKKAQKRSKRSSGHLHKELAEEPNVHWIEQQTVKRRIKRDFGGPSVKTDCQSDDNFNDPEWPQMWYLNRGQGLDMNVQKAWQMGYTGKGVVVTILDDGLEKDHPDIAMNYDALASYDVNGHDEDPQPRYDPSNTNRHGTRCAGEVAAQANNSNCVVGIAFNAKIGGVRMLDGDVTDAVEAQSVGLNPQHIDIYSASWGPDDDGRTVDGPAFLTKRAFVTGVQKGRGGLGSIYVWASGNGGRDGDSCNCDGYTNSIQTLSISSATDNGHIPWYLEQCSSTMATTYSSGSSMERQIVTTDLHHKCTLSHTGTSASAPLAAGIVALALEANPKLGWRDVHHLVVRTARQANLKSSDWVTNGVQRNVSHSFGYGLMDASAMVLMAREWINVGDHHRCAVVYPHRNMKISTRDTSSLILTLQTDGCKDAAQHVKYLEHVQAQLTLSAARRGEIEIYLTSPQGTRSTLLQQRPRDNNRQGFHQWPFMTVFNWGEISYGNWTLEIRNSGWGNLYDFTLIMYGTEEEPPYDVLVKQRRSKELMKAGAASTAAAEVDAARSSKTEKEFAVTTPSVKDNTFPGIHIYGGDSGGLSAGVPVSTMKPDRNTGRPIPTLNLPGPRLNSATRLQTWPVLFWLYVIVSTAIIGGGLSWNSICSWPV